MFNSEVKLKEISRKAKERKPATPKKPRGSSNLSLFLMGGIEAGIIGILYLILRKPEVEYRFVPAKREEPSEAKDDHKEETKKEKPNKKTTPEFELNSF